MSSLYSNILLHEVKKLIITQIEKVSLSEYLVKYSIKRFLDCDVNLYLSIENRRINSTELVFITSPK